MGRPSDSGSGVAVDLVPGLRDEAVDDEAAVGHSTTSPERLVLGFGTSQTTAVVAETT